MLSMSSCLHSESQIWVWPHGCRCHGQPGWAVDKCSTTTYMQVSRNKWRTVISVVILLAYEIISVVRYFLSLYSGRKSNHDKLTQRDVQTYTNCLITKKKSKNLLLYSVILYYIILYYIILYYIILFANWHKLNHGSWTASYKTLI
jgi:K+-transporting ATPase A subunit